MFSRSEIASIRSEKSTCGPQDPASCPNTSPTTYLFPIEKFDYQLLKADQLGSGRWSTVYRAIPSQVCSQPAGYSIDMMTPPITPTHSRSSSWSDSIPKHYAVKVASNKSSRKALRDEAAILSHLSSFTWSKNHIVPFHGYDARNSSLVFSELPATLEDLITKGLSQLDESSRVTKLSSILPRIARSLIEGLRLMHAAKVVHADIKPANILLRPDIPLKSGKNILDVPFTPVFADFTSSFRTDIDSSSTPSAMGGGTYDFLAPELLSKPYPTPSPVSDVYALGITLLSLIIGTSPFSIARGNRFQLLEFAKSGKAIALAKLDNRSMRRLHDTAEAVRLDTRLDINKLLNLGLKKGSNERVTAREWVKMF